MTQVVQTGPSTDAPWYRRESWLLVSVVALVTMMLAMFTPPAWRLTLALLTGVLMVFAVVLLVRRERSVRADEDRERHSTRERDRLSDRLSE